MAWSGGNKRWMVPFVSLNGTSCRIDIYKRGYTGSEVIDLSANNPTTPGVAAANPFAYSEGDDEDLLNNVIRYRTGYLRLIEETYGALDEIYPSVNTDRYVEFYYGTTLDFTGFIQAQSFDRAWVGGPREIELPVISPLGLASGVKFDFTDFNPPRWVSLHTIIYYSLSLLDAGYTGYYFPAFITDDSVSVTKNLYLNSLTICPFAGKYYKRASSGDLAGIYEAKTAEEALRMLCTGFGLILHDIPGAPLFQRLDYQGKNVKYTFPNNFIASSQGVTDMTSVATVASDEGRESMVMPLSEIEVTYEGTENVPKMTFNRCKGYAQSCLVEDNEFCTNSPNISDFDGTFETNIGIDADGKLTAYNKSVLGAYGSGGLSEMFLYQRGEGAMPIKIGSYTFFEWIGNSSRLRFKFKFGEDIENMTNQLPTGQSISIGVLLKSGNQYYSVQSSSWLPLAGYNGYSKTWTSGREDCEVEFLGHALNPLVVDFYLIDAPIDYLISFSDVELLNFETASNEYLDKNKSDYKKSYIIEGGPSDQRGSIMRGCWLSIMTSNKIVDDGNVITGTMWSQIVSNKPEYPHLLTAQDRLQIDVLMPYQTPETLYLNRMEVWGSSGKWRMIARSFDPWNDVYRLTLHHSSIFDY